MVSLVARDAPALGVPHDLGPALLDRFGCALRAEGLWG
jgi:hypothetical protein